jgi:hypothetical protein
MQASAGQAAANATMIRDARGKTIFFVVSLMLVSLVEFGMPAND